MKVFLDTNILIDLIADSRPHSAESRALILEMSNRNIDFHTITSSFKDVYYICRRVFAKEDDLRRAVKTLRELIDPIELTLPILDTAFESDEPDFEDGIIRAAAELSRSDLIVTYDAEAFRNSSVRAATADQALALIRDSSPNMNLN